jgi:CheY-like chemotaxis protein
MPTILLLDNDPMDRGLIRQALSDTEHRLIEVEDCGDFLNRVGQELIDLAIISLTAIPDEVAPRFSQVLLRARHTKLLALAPIEGSDGLGTLMKAESLNAHHLLAKPIDRRQLQMIFNVNFPVIAPQH